MTPLVIVLAVLGALVLIGVAAYGFRRALIARVFGLTPARYGVTVTRGIAVAMPDGVRLMTDHYAPVAQGEFPTILIRTPYGRGKDGSPKDMGFLLHRFAERGYHVVVQDVRGRFMSEGEFDPYVHDADDGKATLSWLSQQPWCNGSVGMWGVSYLGVVQWAVAGDAPPVLKAIMPIVSTPEARSHVFPDGAFGLESRVYWVTVLDFLDNWARLSGWKKVSQMARMVFGNEARKLAPAYAHLPIQEADVVATGHEVPFYREMLRHPRADDPYWRDRDHWGEIGRTTAATHIVGGWYDLVLREALGTYAALRRAGRNPYLTVGPWHHGDARLIPAILRGGVDWFDAQLKDVRTRLRDKPVRIHVMGANQWRELDEWPPPAQATRYYLHPDGNLSPETPPSDAPPDRYRYDPADPTPSVGGPSILRKEAGPKDNRALEARADVLCYTTPPLANDVEAIGPVRLELFVQSSLGHSDFFGRLCDVNPRGRSTNLCDGLVRIEPGTGQAQPDGSLRIELDMWATAYRFRAGHRIRLQVSSGAHPRWNRNLGTGEPRATATRMAIADQTVFHDADRPSALVLPLT